MKLEVEKISEAVQTVWSTMLGLQPEAGDSKSNTLRRVGGSFITSCVQIAGAWRGAVTVDCSVALARQMAAIMLGMNLHEVTPADVNDALGELTNMVGGSVKSLLPEPSSLSLPAVAEGSDFFFQVPNCRTIGQIAFTCDSKPFRVSVLESTR